MSVKKFKTFEEIFMLDKWTWTATENIWKAEIEQMEQESAYKTNRKQKGLAFIMKRLSFNVYNDILMPMRCNIWMKST